MRDHETLQGPGLPGITDEPEEPEGVDEIREMIEKYLERNPEPDDDSEPDGVASIRTAILGRYESTDMDDWATAQPLLAALGILLDKDGFEELTSDSDEWVAEQVDGWRETGHVGHLAINQPDELPEVDFAGGDAWLLEYEAGKDVLAMDLYAATAHLDRLRAQGSDGLNELRALAQRIEDEYNQAGIDYSRKTGKTCRAAVLNWIFTRDDG